MEPHTPPPRVDAVAAGAEAVEAGLDATIAKAKVLAKTDLDSKILQVIADAINSETGVANFFDGDLAGKCDIDPKELFYAMEWLVRQGLIMRSGTGKFETYAITVPDPNEWRPFNM